MFIVHRTPLSNEPLLHYASTLMNSHLASFKLFIFLQSIGACIHKRFIAASLVTVSSSSLPVASLFSSYNLVLLWHHSIRSPSHAALWVPRSNFFCRHSKDTQSASDSRRIAHYYHTLMSINSVCYQFCYVMACFCNHVLLAFSKTTIVSVLHSSQTLIFG